MKVTHFPILFLICMVSLAAKCHNEDAPATQEDERIQLNSLKSEIEDFASTSVCNDTNGCKYIGLGSKPCGGPWEYLIYSTSIDIKKLEELVENYNQKEKAFNTKWDIMSDCAIANPPINLKCENNICIAEY